VELGHRLINKRGPGVVEHGPEPSESPAFRLEHEIGASGKRPTIPGRVARVVIGMLDPNPSICGKGERLLRDHGIEVERFPDHRIVRLEALPVLSASRLAINSGEGTITHNILKPHMALRRWQA